MRTVQEYLKSKQYQTITDEMYMHMQEWLSLYKSETAKKVCEDWANVMMNEKLHIETGSFNEPLQAILKENQFQICANQLVELAYAMGTGAFTEKKVGGSIQIDYILGNQIYPLSWRNRLIVECAFGKEIFYEGRNVIHLEIHRLGKTPDENPKQYYIENKYLEVEGGAEIILPNDVLSVVETGSEKPFFQLIKPNIQNNIDIESPMGISIYANGVSSIKGCQLIYESYLNEFLLGKKRVVVPVSLAKKEMAEDGSETFVFDPKDNTYCAMPGDRQEDLKLVESNMSIRSTEHEAGIRQAFHMLSLQTGMEDAYQNFEKHKVILEKAIREIIEIIAFLSGVENVQIQLEFDESMFENETTLVDENIKLVQAGLRSKLTAVRKVARCSKAEAQEEIQLIKAEKETI